jgi:predicted aspartyl protease
MGGQSLTYNCTISSNKGYGIQLHSLLDTGANGFILINTPIAIKALKMLGTKAQYLPKPIDIKGFDGQRGTQITHVIRFYLTIDHHKQYYVPMLVLDLGNHDIIIGRQWFVMFKVLIDPSARKLYWPKEQAPHRSFARDIIIPRKSLFPSTTKKDHQEDVFKREEVFRLEDKRRYNGICLLTRDGTLKDLTAPGGKISPPTSNSNLLEPESIFSRKTLSSLWDSDFESNIQKMDNKLLNCRKIVEKSYKNCKVRERHEKTRQQKVLQGMQISAISTVGISFYMKSKSNVFASSIHKIDLIIQEKCTEEINSMCTVEPSQGKPEPAIPEYLMDYEDVFSKAASMVLPPYCLYDHKILIEPGKKETLGYSPLYKCTTEELEVAKQYILEQLGNGAIEPTNSPFAAPVLFAEKPNGGLRFCVDYRKLNALTRKDRYPLPLIDEILANVGKARIFTKLDIRAAFHRIRMDPESEELTTFRTRYGTYKYKVVPFGLTNGPSTY